MKFSTLALVASAVAATTVAVAPTAHAEPTALERLCAAQAWPRPVPDVVGLMFEPYSKRIPAGSSGGALACWDDIRAITESGRDATRAAAGGWDTIASVAPPPGTLVDRDQPITVRLAPMDYDAPKSFAACEWVSTTEVSDIFGFTGPIERDEYVSTGSVEPSCTYRSPGRTAVLSRLLVSGAFAVDAEADYSLIPYGNATAITGLGRAARCITGLQGAQGSRYNEVDVLLDGNRLFEAQGLGAQPCDQLTTFAKTAIDRL
ncbi:hypothetical protein [Mycobacterium sp. 1274761.0]|uniref:hypothetical protein n=1 Tax=Mycobacterium sp. 1274761.0 TaxID=1834077 RepID=UPI0007FE8DC6|nr:hypothetical protein [Mycobacterium sp. 1274761.0]OBK74674.1 hypothetical protein A5651_09395 [Mycobacterium sp. 1274761.0]